MRPQVLAFLNDSKENPDDETPRLILADWLEDHGDARGEFVRLQCQPGSSEGARREEQLLASHRHDWLGILTEKGIRTTLQRGLVSVLSRPSKVLSKRLLKIREYEPFAWVEHLSLYGLKPADLRNLVTSPHWTCLSRLSLARNVYYADHLMDPANIGRSSGDWAPLASIPALRTLTGLDFACQDLGNAGATVLAELPNLQRLRSLNLRSNNLGDTGVAALVSSRSLSGLTELNVAQNRLRAEGFAALAAWPGLATVEKLSLDLNYPGDDGIANLAASPWLGRLTSLGLYADMMNFGPLDDPFGPTRVGPAGAEALATARNLPRLARLALSNHRIGPEGALALAASSALPALVDLDLGGNQIGDAGTRALASSPVLRQVTNLSLRYNDIGDVGAMALANSPHLTRLTSLNLRANRAITLRAETALRDRFGAALEFA